MKRISSFPLIISKDAKGLILGSVPGIKSVDMHEYYNHPQNKFWKFFLNYLKKIITTNYAEKVEFVHRNLMEVWNVIDSCERNGSLDTEIRNENHHDILQFLVGYPSIEVIFCNGQKSFKTLQKILPKDFHLLVNVLPSSSPAYTISFEKKLKDWTNIKSYFSYPEKLDEKYFTKKKETYLM
ncbi:DNA-deoxyinosine glycosylase [Chryseobacterium sp. MP_3.2]|uniref:DNA-deoxyinosine glycosylase n=1 Tax=Chryseobacterium sp. MP_3.2 TaxID=3071712 RepID=UPI002E01D48F|nr:hypoxanthine-DNA glycosylase [Chryseobacterium sp. MP_3.2]